VCGEEKPELEFVKVKHFYKYHKANVKWCRECQKMWVEKKQEDARKVEFLAMPFVATVEFK